MCPFLSICIQHFPVPQMRCQPGWHMRTQQRSLSGGAWLLQWHIQSLMSPVNKEWWRFWLSLPEASSCLLLTRMGQSKPRTPAVCLCHRWVQGFHDPLPLLGHPNSHASPISPFSESQARLKIRPHSHSRVSDLRGFPPEIPASSQPWEPWGLWAAITPFSLLCALNGYHQGFL